MIQKNWKIWDKKFYEEIQQEIECLRERELVGIDFREICELNGEFMPVVFILVYYAYRKVKRQLFFLNVNLEIGSYLEEMRFFQLNYVRANGVRYVGENKNHNKYRMIPVYRIYNEKSVSDFTRTSQDILMLDDVEQRLKESIGVVFKELITNGQESSVENSLDVFVYAFGANEESKINLAVVDFGMGFYNSLLRNKANLNQIRNSQDAICAVLSHPVTGRQNGEGGMGYVVIKKIIDKYSGRMLIVSGNAVVASGKGVKKSVQELSKEITGSIIFVQLEKTVETV